MELMNQLQDKYFDLAIVDPPYGIGFSDYERGSSGIKVKERYTKTGKKDWDKGIPTAEYFEQLLRVSKDQIIWGGNYMVEYLKPSMGWIFWDKDNGESDFADAELAWTSFAKAVRMYKYRWNGLLQQDMKNKEIRIHPTQKPVGLYDWIFLKYAKQGDKILDTHLGSQSSRIAANKSGLDFVGFEIDREYYDNGNKRFKNFVSQSVLF
jgi:site-specific DNA-methyltransferase (adenine-specific)